MLQLLIVNTILINFYLVVLTNNKQRSVHCCLVFLNLLLLLSELRRESGETCNSVRDSTENLYLLSLAAAVLRKDYKAEVK